MLGSEHGIENVGEKLREAGGEQVEDNQVMDRQVRIPRWRWGYASENSLMELGIYKGEFRS